MEDESEFEGTKGKKKCLPGLSLETIPPAPHASDQYPLTTVCLKVALSVGFRLAFAHFDLSFLEYFLWLNVPAAGSVSTLAILTQLSDRAVSLWLAVTGDGWCFRSVLPETVRADMVRIIISDD